MNGAYYLFSMIMSVIICYYLTVRDNHYYLMGAYITHVSLHQHNCKSLKGLAPECITNMFSLKTYSINLRTSGTHSLVIPRVNTTRYGLHSLSYYGSKLWNSLPNTTRSLPTVAAFKSAIRNLEFDTDCCPFCKQLSIV